eukprot:7071581-Pyramimonas_sp.AAC.1
MRRVLHVGCKSSPGRPRQWLRRFVAVPWQTRGGRLMKVNSQCLGLFVSIASVRSMPDFPVAWWTVEVVGVPRLPGWPRTV